MLSHSMGTFLSTVKRQKKLSAAEQHHKEHSDAIDLQLREERLRIRKNRESGILLVGLSNSGKSTILKQMKILYQSGFSQAELEDYRHIVYENVLDAALVVLLRMRKLGVKFQRSENELLANRIRAYQDRSSTTNVMLRCARNESQVVDGDQDDDVEDTPGCDCGEADVDTGDEDNGAFIPNIAEAILEISQDPGFQEVLDMRSTGSMDSASYFFSEMQRITAPGYIPNENDVLRARKKTWTISEERFSISDLYPIRIINIGGLRTEKRKWLHCFDKVMVIMFCTALSDYDQVIQDSEDEPRTRLHESLQLYESIINSPWLRHTTSILFMNKIDVFKAKLVKVPLRNYFQDYTGGGDYQNGVKYMRDRFTKQLVTPVTSSTPLIIQAIDTKSVHTVFTEVVQQRIESMYHTYGVL